MIGTQKCGTTTIDGILSEFKEVSHGNRKEHHYFDNENFEYIKYINQFESCDTTQILRSYDATPNYTNPSSKSPEKIKEFYDHYGIPLSKLIFIAIVCPNYHRIPSAYYHNLKYHKLDENFNNIPITDKNLQFNDWFTWILEHLDQDKDTIFKRGFYDQVFEKYFEIFSHTTFVIIDNTYAFEHEQEVGDFLASELILSKQTIPNIHKNSGKKEKEELTESNSAQLQSFYREHERNFFDIVMKNKNVRIFPREGFMNKWDI